MILNAFRAYLRLCIFLIVKTERVLDGASNKPKDGAGNSDLNDIHKNMQKLLIFAYFSRFIPKFCFGTIPVREKK